LGTKIKIIFSIFGDIFNPISFTKYIGIEPAEFWYKGDEIPARNNLFRKESSWHYTIGFVETLFFDEVSKIFLEIFEPKIEKIKEYTEVNKLDVKIFVVIEMGKQETPALFFDKQFLNAVNKLNAEIDIDLYK
jgi:hypothetical protein